MSPYRTLKYCEEPKEDEYLLNCEDLLMIDCEAGVCTFCQICRNYECIQEKSCTWKPKKFYQVKPEVPEKLSMWYIFGFMLYLKGELK